MAKLNRKAERKSGRPLRRPHTIAFRISPKEMRRLRKAQRPDENISECARRLLFETVVP